MRYTIILMSIFFFSGCSYYQDFTANSLAHKQTANFDANNLLQQKGVVILKIHHKYSNLITSGRNPVDYELQMLGADERVKKWTYNVQHRKANTPVVEDFEVGYEYDILFLPPGEYYFSKIKYGSTSNYKCITVAKDAAQQSNLHRFTVKAGAVEYIGDLNIIMKKDRNYALEVTDKITAAVEQFKDSYPELAHLKVEKHLIEA